MSDSNFEHAATYSPEDDKLRIYLSYRLDKEEYQKVKDAGFRDAKKQGCQFAHWTPNREDFCLEMAGEITAEGTTLAERAAAKAERLDALASKRANQANSFAEAAHRISERFSYGQPILVGHHSERSARRDKARMESAMNQSIRCADAVDYWNYRAAGVERHANRVQRDDVRERRIKKLLAELRGYQRDINTAYKNLEMLETINPEMDSEIFNNKVTLMSGFTGVSPDYMDEGVRTSAWFMLGRGKKTALEVWNDSITNQLSIIGSERKLRCINHMLNRLAFERSELGEIEKFQGNITPVIIQGFLRTHGTDKPKAVKTAAGFKAVSSVPFPLHIGDGLEIELSAEDWKNKMQASGYIVEQTERRKTTSKAASIPLINLTEKQGALLQAVWNSDSARLYKKHGRAPVAAEIEQMTQAKYAANSKGDYALLKTITLDDTGREVVQRWQGMERVSSGVPVCRVRVYVGGADMYKARSLVLITDKPKKELPFEIVLPAEETTDEPMAMEA
ncbi:MAG: DUF3560 domain-containing protein [Cellvibrionaceae bacterium]